MQVLLTQDAHAQRIDQGVTGIARVEDRFAADVRQPQRVAVTADTADHTVEHPASVGGIGGAEAQLVHHRDRPRTHRHDVADDAADTRGRTLVGLDVGGVVVRFHLERDGPPVTDVDDAGVLADSGQHPGAHFIGGGLAEIAQMDFGGLVGAVLAPHHRVHGELGVGGPTAQDVTNPLILVVFEAQLVKRLRLVGGDCVSLVAASARHADSLESRAASLPPETRGKKTG